MCNSLWSVGGSAAGLGCTCAGAIGFVDWSGALVLDGAWPVEVALLRIEDVDGYCLRPAAPAAFPATFEAEEPIVFDRMMEDEQRDLHGRMMVDRN